MEQTCDSSATSDGKRPESSQGAFPAKKKQMMVLTDQNSRYADRSTASIFDEMAPLETEYIQKKR